MSTKKDLFSYRMKVFNLLDKRAKYVDARSYNFFKNKIFSAQKAKLEDIYSTLKNVKKLPDTTITKKSFNDVLAKVKNLKQEVKVIVFGNFKYTYPQSNNRKSNSKMSREAIDTFTVRGKSAKAIKRIIKDKMENYEEYANDIDSSHKVMKSLVSIDYEQSAVSMKSIPLNKIPMKSSFVLHRDWLKYAEGIDKKAYADMEGRCVYELLSSHLSNPAKRINMTTEKLFDIFNDFYKSQNNVSDLDYGVADVFEGNFTMESGVTTEMIRYLCEQRKISLYAFDVKENCFEKVVYSQTSNYRPIVYYMIDGHMYLITNKDVVKSLASAQKINKNTIVSSMLEADEEVTFDTTPIVECESFAEAIKMKDCIVYLPVQEITSEVHQYIRDTKTVPYLRVEHHQITQMKLDNTTIICDRNLLDGYSWKDIKDICDKAGIPFKNQRIGALIAHLRKKFFKTERRVLTADEKSAIVSEQQSVCVLCDEKTDVFEFDHIESLANGGSNELDNFQALCKPCHLNKTMEERENSDFIKFDPVASTFNEKSLEIIRSQHFKQWAFIEKLEDSVDSDVHKIDHSKCRRNLVMHSTFDYPMFSVMDYPTVYDGGAIVCGFYFVETDNYFPLRGNGWYNYTMVKYCIEQNIQLKITHMFIPSFSIKSDYFKKFTEFLVHLTEGSNLGKLIVNSLVGCWGIQSTQLEHITLTTDKYEASRELCRDGVFVSSEQLSEDTTLYSIIEKLMIKKDDSFLPLYNQIVAMEAIELHKLEQIIIAQEGVPLERNTDAILYRGNKIDISKYFWDIAGTVAKYRYDDVSRLARANVCSIKRAGSFVPATFEFKQLTEHDDFHLIANDVLASNTGCFVSGVAGTGKTYLARTIIDTLEKAGKNCSIKLAPTNKAREHLGEGAMTIHKYYLSLFLSNNYEKKLLKNLNNVDYIVIDEVSMIREVFFRFFMLIKRYVPKIKFIIIGDFAQLKPVNDSYQGEYNGPALHCLCDGVQINLKRCRRSDAALFNLYTNIESVDTTQFPVRELTELNIAYTHKTRKDINRQCMDKFSVGKEWIFAHKSSFNKKTQTSKLFVGMPIVAHRNFKKEGIFNSELFTISHINFQSKTFSFVDGDTTQTFPVKLFSSMFFPAFCLTAHTSQGCTFNTKYTIYDWNHPRMDQTAKYVALSRATSIQNIQINL